MSRSEPDDVRIAAESIYGNIRPMNYRGAYQSQTQFDLNRGHSINLISEDLLGGYMLDGRMSVVRRFFCLFVTFDLVFISLLWLICIMITGDSIFNALQKQVLHYTIYTSFFDVVGTAICRFIILILFYGVCYINHWLIIATSTSFSCIFLISKVFYFDWVGSPQPIFGVVLIVTSFVLSWGEAWFFDCRVIPQERHARSYFSAFTSNNDRSPLMAPFLASEGERPPESIANFYSPFDSVHNSDDEEEQDEEYRQMGLDCVRKAYELLQSSDWKVEKVTQKGDTIQSTQREKLGKIYRLTGRIKFPAKALLDDLFHKVEAIPKWNPTLLESKIVRKVNSYTDITYHATVSGGGGLVKSRDFVNLRCWRLCRDGKVVVDSDEEDDNKSEDDDDENLLNRSCEGSVSTTSAENDYLPSSVSSSSVKQSKSFARLSENRSSPSGSGGIFRTLSKSLGAKDFQGQFDLADPPPLEDDFQDAKDYPSSSVEVKKSELPKTKDKIYISAAISIEYPSMPPVAKYTRGENLVSCWAMREVDGKSDVCIFEWLLCLDLKGYMPRYVLDNAYTTFMTDYMTHLRKYVCELRQKRKKSASHRYSALDDD